MKIITVRKAQETFFGAIRPWLLEQTIALFLRLIGVPNASAFDSVDSIFSVAGWGE